MNLIKVILIVFVCTISIGIFAQSRLSDTTIIIKEVVISSSRLQNFGIGSNVQKIDSLILANFSNQSFADLLSTQSLVQINTYGSGGLSSPSVRSGGASHTAVIWNGVNIQSPMNGATNLALLPVRLFGDVHIQYGGSGTLLGNGAMSGAIHFKSSDLFQKKNQFVLGIGNASFGGKNFNLSFKLGNEILASSISLYQNKAINDFKFRNIAKFNQPIERQTNAEYDQHGIVFEAKVKTGGQSVLSSSVWYQEFDKNLQTLMINSDTGKSSQYDKNIYALLKWQHSGQFMNLKIKTALINDIQKYTNPSLLEPISNNRALSLINEIELKWAVSKHQILNLGFNYTYEEVNSDGYNGIANQNRVALFASYKFTQLLNRLDLVGSFRKEMLDNGSLPLVYSLDAKLKLSSNISMKGNISKNYNLPSLNDLFWRSDTYASGNPNLKAEHGWSGEMGFSETILTSQPLIKLEQSLYYSEIDDWIVWLPNVNGIWTPENKRAAKIMGLDLNLNSTYKIKQVEFKLTVKYNWNSSKFRNSDEPFLPMIYVPENVFLFNLSADMGRLTINYNHKFTDERLYDQNHSLPSYHLSNLSCNYKVPMNKNLLNLFFKINNIWNENYQVMAWYAMAPIHYQFSIFYRLNNI